MKPTYVINADGELLGELVSPMSPGEQVATVLCVLAIFGGIVWLLNRSDRLEALEFECAREAHMRAIARAEETES